jgi:hypothetical protein
MAAIIAIGVPKEKPAKPTMSLPLDALSTDGAEPEVGDQVEHSIKGTISAIKGDMATIKLTALDGQPIEGAPEEEAGESPEEEQTEEGSEGEGESEPTAKSSKNPGNPGPPRGRGRRAGPPINIPGLPPAATAVGNPLAAALGAPRARARAQTAALGAGLRRRARGQPVPLM